MVSFGVESGKIPDKLKHSWNLFLLLDVGELKRIAAGRAQAPVEILRAMMLEEQFTLEGLTMQYNTLFLSNHIEMMDECPRCRSRNEPILIEDVIGLDNVPDLSIWYACSNPSCVMSRLERGRSSKIYVRFARCASTRPHGSDTIIVPLVTEH